MFWPAMIVFILLATAPFASAIILNRLNGDSISDVDDVDLVAEDEA